jgi:hypothetical protein
MLALPELFGSDAVTLVALRESSDDYRNRAWCLAEALLTANKAGSQGVAVRMDLLGTRLELGAEGQERNLDLSGRLRAALDGSAPQTAIRAFYEQCMKRHLSGRPLVVRPMIEPGQMFSYEDLRLTFE